MIQNASINSEFNVEDAFRTILRTNLAAMERWKPAALVGEDVEGVHQMRVGLRRMRSALTVFRPAVPRKATSPWAVDMRWAAKELDQARDLDVYITESLSAKANGREKRLGSLAGAHREKAYDGVNKMINGRRFKGFSRDFPLWLEARGWRDKLPEQWLAALEEPVLPFATGMLDRRLAKVLCAGEEVRSLDAQALHDLRIECKKLRYAAEFFAPLFGAELKILYEHLKTVQDLLGTLNDTTVMSSLHDRLLHRNRKRGLARVARKLEKRRAKEARTVMQEFESRWCTFSECPCPWSARGAGSDPTPLTG